MKSFQRFVRQPATIALMFALFFGAGFFNSCQTLNALAGLSKLQFKLDNIGQVSLAGVNLQNKRSASDFSVMDGLNLVNAFRTGRFPLTFTLNVAAKNPNERSANLSSVELTEFPWRLMVDGKETIYGEIGSPVSVPSGGETRVLPLSVSIDLKQFFGDRGYDDILNLALTLAGQGGTSKLQLMARPSLRTPIGAFRYPSELTIVDHEFRS